MNNTICLIYDRRPDICRKFPTCESEIQEFKSCGYSFKDGVRVGECNGCGECCIRMPFAESLSVEACSLLDEAPLDLATKDEDGMFIKTDAVCRFLTQE